MDRSFLSKPEVIAASRAFVCVRLTTYEDKEEGEFLTTFRVTCSGELENTVFTILSSDGKKQLARALTVDPADLRRRWANGPDDEPHRRRESGEEERYASDGIAEGTKRGPCRQRGVL